MINQFTSSQIFCFNQDPIPFEALSRVNRSRLAPSFLISFIAFLSSLEAFNILIRVEVAREQSIPPCHSREGGAGEGECVGFIRCTTPSIIFFFCSLF
jgi:hypothetical protein